MGIVIVMGMEENLICMIWETPMDIRMSIWSMLVRCSGDELTICI